MSMQDLLEEFNDVLNEASVRFYARYVDGPQQNDALTVIMLGLAHAGKQMNTRIQVLATLPPDTAMQVLESMVPMEEADRMEGYLREQQALYRLGEG